MGTPTAPAPRGATPPPAPPATRDDWAAQAADTIDRVVTGIGDKTAGKLTVVAAAIVYGLVIAAAVTAILVLASIAAIRALAVYLPIDPYERSVWISEAIVGGIFTLGGLFFWRKRRPKKKKA